MPRKYFWKILGDLVRAKVSRLLNLIDWETKFQNLEKDYYVLREERDLLKYGNEQLKKQNKAILTQTDESQIKKDLNEAINIVVDYQKTLYRAGLPDPNIQRANDLFNKWGLTTQRVSNVYKILLEGKDITMGREY